MKKRLLLSSFFYVLLLSSAHAQTYNLQVGDASVLAEFPDNDQIRVRPFGTTGGNTGGIKLYELTANGGNYVGFRAPDDLGINNLYTLPNGYGTAGYFLGTDGGGGLTWSNDVPSGDANYIHNQNLLNQTADWRITGSGQWGGATSKGFLSTDQGSSLELGGSGSPYIDLANAIGDDFDARIQLTGDDLLSISGANVGIGTSSPSRILELSGTAPGIKITDPAATGNSFVELSTVDGGLSYFQNVSGRTRIYVGGDERMTFLNGGNVGIGTTTPLGKLHVETGGDASWNKFVVKTTSFWGDGTASVSETAGTQYVTIGAQTAGIMINNPHVVWNNGNTAAAIRYGRSGGINTGDWWEAGVNSAAGFHIRKTAVAATGIDILSNGNVGIGTSAPAYKLDVNGGARVVRNLLVSTNNTDDEGIFLADDGSIVDRNDGYATHRFSNGLAITSGYNANTQRILLRSDGNIQMVNNQGPTLNFNDSDEPDYYLHNNSDRLYVLHGDGYNGWNTNRPLTVFQGDKVGINEISPSWRLQVNGANTTSFLAQQNGTHSYGIVAGLETFNNGSATQDGPRLGFHKHGAKTWSIGIQPYGNNGFAIWEDGYSGGWGSDAKFIIPPGGGLNKVIISSGGSFYQDWPGGWGGGLSSWDMCVASIRLSGTSNRSDARLKKDIENVGDNAVSTVMALRPVSYRWIDEKLPQRKIYGFVAQEVQNVLPEIIEEGTDEMKTLGMSYTDLIPILTKATQEQQLQIEAQKQEIDQLKVMVDKLLKAKE